jgi:hypothetical protein
MVHIFEQKTAPDYGPNILKEIQEMCPNVFLVVMRSKNENVVVYEANIENGKFNKNNPVNVYWLNLAPEYRKGRRKRGILHDKEDLNLFERKFVWGCTTKHVDQSNEKEVNFSFNVDSTHKMKLKITPCGKKARLFMVWKGNKYWLRSGYAAATENITINLRNNLIELSFNTIDVQTKKQATIRIK